jgi:hypothetical protein
MRKLVPFLLLLIVIGISCAGVVVKSYLPTFTPYSTKPNPLSEININYCLQSGLGLLFFIIFGGVPLFFPRQMIGWIQTAYNWGVENPSPVRIKPVAVRLFGGFFFVSAIIFTVLNPITWNECRTGFNLLR